MYPWPTGESTNAVCTPTISTSGTTSGKLIGLTLNSGGGGYPNGFYSGGMILENVNLFASTGEIQDGLWMEGLINPLVGHLHCQGMYGYCEHIAAGNLVAGGAFLTHDTLSTATGLIDLGPGIDGNLTLISMRAAASGQYIVYDEANKVYLTATASSLEIGQYFPGGLALNSHLNNGTTPNDNAGTCPLTSATTCTVTFTTHWNVAPVCVATDQSSIATVQASPSTTQLVLSVSTSSSDTLAYQCEGNPN
jgi:hypothetical protein